MRVGIITFHCSYNFGSALQAFALQQAISSLGHEVEIIDYRSRDFYRYRIIKLSRPWTIPSSLKKLDRLLERKQAFRSFWSSHFHLTERFSYRDEGKLESLAQRFDCFVCGSDQIWNLDCTSGVVDPFFLSFAGGCRRVAYAPSLAHTEFKVENFDRDRVADLLAQFDSLSVREEETLPLFQPLVDKRIEVVLDPTLLLDAKDYRDVVKERPDEEPYLFVYLLRECPELVESASRIALSSGHRVYYIYERELPIPNSVNLFGSGPEGFLSLIWNADAVLTNSFHATAFSTLFHRPFRAFVNDRSASRMRGLMDGLGMSDCCAMSIDDSPIGSSDWDSIDKKLLELRVSSWNYLRKALL